MPNIVNFETTILKFNKNGDKTNWTYILIPLELAEKLNPGWKKSFRVTGSLDNMKLEKVALIPTGEGNFIMAINAGMRKQLKKNTGAKIKVKISRDDEPPPINEELIGCLKDEPKAWKNFEVLPRSHQLYFSNWINSAKTEITRANRIARAVDALFKNLDYGEMIRSLKKDK